MKAERYYLSNESSPDIPEGSVYLGTIQSQVPFDQVPTKEFQSNAASAGDLVYRVGERLFIYAEAEGLGHYYDRKSKGGPAN